MLWPLASPPLLLQVTAETWDKLPVLFAAARTASRVKSMPVTQVWTDGVR